MPPLQRFIMSKARAYVGIDSHSEFHKVAILPMFLMEGIAEEGDWEKNVKPKIKPSKVGNNREAYEGLHKVLATHGDPSEIVIGLEYTGGHYTAPLSHFLSGKGYQMWFVEAKAMKQFKEKFLGESNKTDKVDSREIGFYLYARAVLKRKLRVSTIRPEIGTQSAVIKQMIAHRWTIQKAITQTTNRLHGLMKSSFPEGEEEYFAQLLEIIPKYPTPKAILEESSGLADVKHMRKAVKADILKLAKETVGVPAEQYGYAIRTLATEREALQSQLEKVNQRIDYIVANHPYGTILRSFPQI
ncbi:MAG: IS110 family transposase, partial [Chloroflexi bacterium]|nr:IS110 family transposase [Chloroflexota bacterium]